MERSETSEKLTYSTANTPYLKALLLYRELSIDIAYLPWDLLVNTVAGNRAVPRAHRFALYRYAGLDIRTPNINSGVIFTGKSIQIGRGTFVNWGCFFEGGPITIGERCQIGMQALFTTGHHPRLNDGSLSAAGERLDIVVGNDCWIGARAILLPGVQVASNVTIGAGSVVTKDLTEPGTYAGVPARPLHAPRVPSDPPRGYSVRCDTL